MTDILCSTPSCCNTLDPYATDGGDEYRTGDEGGRCAECHEHRACVCCGDSYRFDPVFPEVETCEACQAETAAYFRERYAAGDPVTFEGEAP